MARETEQGAMQGAQAGASTGNPWAALGGAVLGAGMGWKQGQERDAAEKAARRDYERRINHANKYAVFFDEGQRVADQERPTSEAGKGFSSGLMTGAQMAGQLSGMDWGGKKSADTNLTSLPDAPGPAPAPGPGPGPGPGPQQQGQPQPAADLYGHPLPKQRVIMPGQAGLDPKFHDSGRRR